MMTRCRIKRVRLKLEINQYFPLALFTLSVMGTVGALEQGRIGFTQFFLQLALCGAVAGVVHFIRCFIARVRENK